MRTLGAKRFFCPPNDGWGILSAGIVAAVKNDKECVSLIVGRSCGEPGGIIKQGYVISGLESTAQHSLLRIVSTFQVPSNTTDEAKIQAEFSRAIKG